MNDRNRISAEAPQHPGRMFLLLGALLPLAGIAIYVILFNAKVLTAPWYVPLLATAGVALLVLSLARSRSIWRWSATVFFTLLAAGEWLMLLVVLAAPPYAGPKAGDSFPAFSTTRDDGSPFTQANLKGDKNSVMVFFRGRW